MLYDEINSYSYSVIVTQIAECLLDSGHMERETVPSVYMLFYAEELCNTLDCSRT